MQKNRAVETWRGYGDLAGSDPDAGRGDRRQRSSAPMTGVTIASAVAPTSRNVTSTPRLDEFGFMPHLIARMRPRGRRTISATLAPRRRAKLAAMARALAILLLAPLGAAPAACGKRAAPPETQRAVRIGKLGASVDAPPNWEITAIGKDSYRVGLAPGEQVFVREVAFPPRTVDELYATECARAIEPGTKATTPAGAMIVECRLASTDPDGKEVELVHVASLIRTGDRGIKCHFGIEGNAADAAAVCRSLRP